MHAGLKIRGAICLAAMIAPPLALAADLSIPAQIAGPASSILVPVMFVTQGDSVSGLQFDLSFDAPAISLNAVAGNAARDAGKTIYVAALYPNRSRFLITALNQTLILDGTVVDVFVNVSQGTSPGNYSIHVESAIATDPAGRPIAISATDGSLTVEPSFGTPIAPEGLLSGASLLPGPVAPGEIVTIFGSGIAPPAMPGPTEVSFDSLPAPLLYAYYNQINAVVPFGIAGRTGTTLTIASPSGPPMTVSAEVVSAAPAIFTLSGSGNGSGAILNQDGTTNTPDNPAPRGSIISIFATGAGQTNPPGMDGTFPGTVLPVPLLPVSIRIGGVRAEILYAGAAPGLVSGALQVNCRVPADAAPGQTVPVLLSVGDATASPVTVALR